MDKESTDKALVSNIQRFSLDDGPGIRTTVFFQGCTLSCAWCHNPECITAKAIMQFNTELCSGCGHCVPACTQGARKLVAGRLVFSREKCVACAACVPVCFKNTMKRIGQLYTPKDLLLELIKDRHYFSSSGGGVTFSGGEPAMIPEYTAKIASLCKEVGLHVALDTAGHVPFRNYELLLPYIDLFLYDVKCFNPVLHKRWIGADNTCIIENLKRLDALGVEYTIRIPIISDFNDTPEEHKHVAAMLTSLQKPGLVELLPYHSYGSGKYEMLGMQNTILDHTPPSREILETILEKYTILGLNAHIS